MTDVVGFEQGPIRAILEGDFPERIHVMTPEECSFDVARAKMDQWRDEGKTSVFIAGTFDILTLNHNVGLTESRMYGAMAILGMAKTPETEQQLHEVHDVLSSNRVRLMVSMDTNEQLKRSKSRNPEKGGAPKPILDWDNRAAMLAQVSVPTPDYRQRRNTVDFITRHGIACCLNCAHGTCTNRDNALMTVGLAPDVVVVNSASTATVTDTMRFKGEGKLPDTQISVQIEGENQYFDKVLGGPLKNTSMIKRIRS